MATTVPSGDSGWNRHFFNSQINRLRDIPPLGEPLVAVEVQLQPQQHASHEFIAEQIEKCDRKLREEDYDGAITNARSAVEAVLSDIESRLDPASPPYDGDLAKLYKRVQKVLNLDPERPDIGESLRQLLRGLVNIIGDLAPLRNKMGDAHVRTYKPARHHAKLGVNAAKTLLDFVYDSFEYQKATGKITEGEAKMRANRALEPGGANVVATGQRQLAGGPSPGR